MSTERIPYRGGLVCRCVYDSFPLVESVMITQGLIKESIDVYQWSYRSNVSASAGTHSRGGCIDVGQYSDACLKVWRTHGWCMQHRTPAQGFMHHAHGWPNGCSHLSPAAKVQQRAWNNGRNGLVSNGRITGPGPIGKGTPHWTEGIKKMEEYLVGFKEDVAAAVVAKLDYNKIADAVLNRDAIPNTVTGNTANTTVTLKTALAEIGRNTELLQHVPSPGGPQPEWDAAHILDWLARQTADQGSQLAALAAAVAAITPQEPAA